MESFKLYSKKSINFVGFFKYIRKFNFQNNKNE